MKQKKTPFQFSHLSTHLRVGLLISISYHLLLFASFIVVYLTDPFESDPEVMEMFVSPVLPPSNELPTRLISTPPSLSENKQEMAEQAKNDTEDVRREEPIKEKEPESKPETVKSTQEKSPRPQDTMALRKKQEKKDRSKKTTPQKKTTDQKKTAKTKVTKSETPPKSAKEPVTKEKDITPSSRLTGDPGTAISANTPAAAAILQRKKSLALLVIQQALGKGRGRLITEEETQYIDCIKTQVLEHWAVDPHTAGQPVGQAMILVILNREGVIEKAELQTPSGNELYDRAALEAVLKVQPCSPPSTVQSEERRRLGLAIYFP
ncbi:MAG: TonB family protein [Deltaproteobacteria bacterium]|nr:TonB family protein [Deltaproteobacteria bacterium]